MRINNKLSLNNWRINRAIMLLQPKASELDNAHGKTERCSYSSEHAVSSKNFTV